MLQECKNQRQKRYGGTEYITHLPVPKYKRKKMKKRTFSNSVIMYHCAIKKVWSFGHVRQVVLIQRTLNVYKEKNANQMISVSGILNILRIVHLTFKIARRAISGRCNVILNAWGKFNGSKMSGYRAVTWDWILEFCKVEHND